MLNESYDFMQGWYYLEEYNKYLIIRAVDNYIILDDREAEVNYILQEASGNSTILSFIADTQYMALPIWSTSVLGAGVFERF